MTFDGLLLFYEFTTSIDNMVVITHEPRGDLHRVGVSYMKAVIILCIFASVAIWNVRQWTTAAPGNIIEAKTKHGLTDLSEFSWHQVRTSFKVLLTVIHLSLLDEY